MFKQIEKMPDYKQSATNTLEVVRARVKPEVLRRWAKGLFSKYTNLTEVTTLTKTRIPKTVRDLGETYPGVIFIPGRNNGSLIMIYWGGVFEHRGIVVCEGTEPPANPDMYYLKWQEDIYICNSSR